MARIIAGHTNSYHTYSFEESLRGIAAAGYAYAELSAVENWAEFVSPYDEPDTVRAQLMSHGLVASSMSAHVNLFHPDGLAKAQRIIRWAGEYGVPVVNAALASKPTRDSSTAGIVDGLRHLGAVAVESNVVVAVEVHGDVAPSGAAALELIREVGSPAVKINYDTGNVEFYAGIRAVDDLPGVIEHIAHIHLKDKLGDAGVWHFPALGGGHVDFAGLLDLLTSRGVDVPMSVELEFSGEPWPPLTVVDDAMLVSRRRLLELGYLE
ncbi:MAG: sugar phosphate isomerase/epimerase family protein [Terrimesophilobacter sp.]